MVEKVVFAIIAYVWNGDEYEPEIVEAFVDKELAERTFEALELSLDRPAIELLRYDVEIGSGYAFTTNSERFIARRDY